MKKHSSISLVLISSVVLICVSFYMLNHFNLTHYESHALNESLDNSPNTRETMNTYFNSQALYDENGEMKKGVSAFQLFPDGLPLNREPESFENPPPADANAAPDAEKNPIDAATAKSILTHYRDLIAQGKRVQLDEITKQFDHTAEQSGWGIPQIKLYSAEGFAGTVIYDESGYVTAVILSGITTDSNNSQMHSSLVG